MTIDDNRRDENAAVHRVNKYTKFTHFTFSAARLIRGDCDRRSFDALIPNYVAKTSVTFLVNIFFFLIYKLERFLKILRKYTFFTIFFIM